MRAQAKVTRPGGQRHGFRLGGAGAGEAEVRPGAPPPSSNGISAASALGSNAGNTSFAAPQYRLKCRIVFDMMSTIAWPSRNQCPTAIREDATVANRFPLSDLIDVVTNELRIASSNAAAQGSQIMQFAECELEMAIDVEKNGSGGINVWVVQLGGGAKKTDSNTIRVTFKALPEAAMVFVQGSPVDAPGPELGKPPVQGE
jgi:hypothetical protein